jgi:hypothetical protein
MRRILVGLLGLALFAMSAYAATEGQWGRRVAGSNTSSSGSPSVQIVGGVNTSDTTFVPITINGTTGALTISDASPARTDFLDGSTPIIDDTTSIGFAESSAVINVGKYRLHSLAIRVAGTPTAVTMAVQIRFHLNSQSDSSSIFPWYVRRTGGAAADTTSNYLAAQTAGAANLSRTEFAVLLQADGIAAAKWGNQAHAYINLADKYGVEEWAPYVSVRIRVLSGANVSVKVYLLGTPL